MAYLDFDLEIEESSGGRDYRVVARSAAGDTRAVMRFPYDELALESALDKLQIALLRSGGPARRRILSPEEQAVQDFGRAHFAALFSEDVRGLYDASRLKASQEGKDGVRLRLRVLAPELAALPWEYLYDPRQSSYLCLSRATPLVRYPEVAQPITPLRVTPPLRILGMIASPGDMDPLDVEREQGRIRAALKDLTAQGLVQLDWLPGQTWRHLQRAMRGGPWHIFHFIGHGGFHQGEGVLALADDEGKTSLLSATQLSILLANHGPLRLAVLNACEGARADKRDLFSSTAATLARRGLPAVLAMQYDITDRAAIEYTRAFYEALADQLPVDAALAEARAAIQLDIHNSLEWGTPVLYLRAPDGMLFDMQGGATPRPQEATPAADTTPAPSPTPTRSAQPEQREPEQPKPPAKTKEDWLKEGDALVHYKVERYEEALACYEQALALDPTFVPALSGKAEALHGLRRYKEALAVAEHAVQLDPKDARAHNGRGEALNDLYRYEEGLAAHERAIQLNPLYAIPYNNMGFALNQLKRYEEALAACERAIQLDPQLAVAYNLKGWALKGLGRKAEAKQAWEKARKLGLRNGLSWLSRLLF
ncbi:MAG TPA: CHAT domain-containing protein [Ktedonobacterales bacterium]|nr:CHAT domain-containing protein [Ktedonobacterales bacterium]